MPFPKNHTKGTSRKTEITLTEPESPPSKNTQTTRKTYYERKAERGETNAPAYRFNNVHHCGDCFEVLTQRCYDAGHVVDCPKHGRPHMPSHKCVQCANEEILQAKRDKEERLEAEKAKAKEKENEGWGTRMKNKAKKKTQKLQAARHKATHAAASNN